MLPHLRQIAPEPTQVQVKKRLAEILRGYVRGAVPSQRYAVLKEAKQYAIANNLELPVWVQPELSRAAQNLLKGFTELC
ncbi:hypothetical protein NIES2135_53480 [Leptolyngbya boryana NIES-2135]|jgi:hypothetical protein|uniref:Uncharacterized protein n=1 Tax=Leptolyngbya boryana NIES-2135 TaxID=1973484 RepID=A0A1Z4JNY1_LEPBY|nr:MULTISPECIES: hypothetical protein [Leptolyngbya]BAY58475.1 hypothetical protein NIES2135_53480 [Leptolyngbya boryana NIES-2135]MBD2370949.1 hypothetical protein [Leptolyngbya sp. FACHB-161]MBD2377463.1 hypothetical protein [Leptolyngbya sp. FACHB-238]MBD2401871.1 hypothetical protein [Leptolyngbya sp. FACHB-239]MBD2408389.1 hypothetical protein [Leptolyngbya sp. FACHB-402]